MILLSKLSCFGHSQLIKKSASGFPRRILHFEAINQRATASFGFLKPMVKLKQTGLFSAIQARLSSHFVFSSLGADSQVLILAVTFQFVI